MQISIASDHAGFALKEHLRRLLAEKGHEVEDLGPTSADRVDYPDFALRVAQRVSAEDGRMGVLVCGSGIGMSMAANRVKGARAVVAMNQLQASLSRQHNDANILCLGERLVGYGLAESILEAFLLAEFSGGRHADRVAKIEAI